METVATIRTPVCPRRITATGSGNAGGAECLADGHAARLHDREQPFHGDGQIAGGIFGDGLTLINTIVANNTAMFTPTCDAKRGDGSGNLQGPDGSLCTASPLVADPQLGVLGANGGDTETLEPASASPARGLGTGCPATDQRGNPRADPCAVEAP